MTEIIAAIMAGGRGTRFKPYSDLIIKPMLPIGPDGGYPLLYYIISWLKRHEIRDIVILAGYKWRQIYNYFRDGNCFGVKIRYSLDDEKYSGTGGAIVKAYREGLLDADTVLVWYGDILAPLNVKAMISSHLENQAHITVAVSRGYRIPVGVAEIGDKMNIVSIKEKPILNINVTIGILAIQTEVLKEIYEDKINADIMGDLIPRMIQDGKTVQAYIHDGPWYDVGSLERYMKLPTDNIVKMFDI